MGGIALPESRPPPSRIGRIGRIETGAGINAYENESHSCFLDTFPTEVLNNVLRFFSRLPTEKDWVPHVPLENIIELYGVRGHLRTFMKTRFNTLCISQDFKHAAEIEKYKWKKRKQQI